MNEEVEEGKNEWRIEEAKKSRMKKSRMNEE